MLNPAQTSHKHVLLAEDSAITQDILELAISSKGHEISIVSNAAEAIKALKYTEYDIAFIDFHLPDRNGIELVREYFQSNPKTTIPRLVALTGDAEEVFKLDQKGEHFDLILAKPFMISDLVDIIEAKESVLRPAHSPLAPQSQHIPRPAPLFEASNNFHIIYFPFDFYTSFKNAVSMSVAQNGPVDALVLDSVPSANEAQMLTRIKGMAPAVHIDRTGKLTNQCDIQINETENFDAPLRSILQSRLQNRKDIHPSFHLSKSLETNLMISMLLKGGELHPQIDFGHESGIVYNHILSATDVLHIAQYAVEKGFFKTKTGERIYLCPHCHSSRLYPRRLDFSSSAQTVPLLCTDCNQTFLSNKAQEDFMAIFSLTQNGRNYLSEGMKIE